VLSPRKLRLAAALGSRALRTDAVEGIACGWLSLVVMIGLLAQLVFGAWWVDEATALPIVGLLVREGSEAWRGEDEED
jgi:divalent metal cation (Fe/Co/Zn/Cd) transporter